MIKLVVGLGNPGDQYARTRHSLGYRVIDRFCTSHNGTWKMEKKLRSLICIFNQPDYTLVLAKPTTYMNDSGCAVQKVCQFYKILPNDVIVVYDDIGFDVGDYRITPRVGTGGHNGVADILPHIGPGFTRFRVGIGQKKFPDMDLKEHVLSRFTEREEEILAKMFPEILNDLQLLLDKGAEYSMNLINRKKKYGQSEEVQG